MKDSEFNDLVDQCFDDIEDSLDELDLDFDQAEGVLTIECPDESVVILSRQITSHEIWVAARSGGFHLSRIDNHWVSSKTSESLQQLLERALGEQTGEAVKLDLKTI